MQNTPKFNCAQSHPRVILDRQIWRFQFPAEFNQIEATVERLGYVVEVEAARPSHIIALTAALRALGSLS